MCRWLSGEVAANMSMTLGAPMALTGHSLGRNKREHLLKGGTMTGAEVETVYHMSRCGGKVWTRSSGMFRLEV